MDMPFELNPEFFTIEQLKQVGLWESYNFLSAYGMIPYLRRMKQNITGIEIGVLKGENVYTLLTECTNIEKIYGVDFYEEHKDYDNVRSTQDMQKYFEISTKNLSEFGDRYELLKMKSNKASKNFEDESVDFILVDGDHTTQGIYEDIKKYYPKLKKNGYIFVHDTNRLSVMDGIKKFRNEFKVRIPLNTSKNFTVFWIKK